jgi:toxin ParE1/3/4
MRLVYTKAAEADLETILSYIAERNPQAAADLAARIVRAEDQILAFPQAARYDRETETYELYIPQTRVILIYHFDSDLIEIIAVFHTSRDPSDKPRS